MDIKGLFSSLFEGKAASEKKSAFPINGNGIGYVGPYVYSDAKNRNLSTIIQYYESVAPFNTAVDKIAKAVAGLPIILVNRTTEKQADANHPLLQLLHHPNDNEQTTKSDFFRDLTIWKILDGNVYVNFTNISTLTKQLTILKPQYITIQTSGGNIPITYRYNDGTKSLDFTKNPAKNRFLTSDKKGDLLPIRTFNPSYTLGGLKGASESNPIYEEIERYQAINLHNIALMNNGARPSGALIIKTDPGQTATLSPEEFDRLQDQMDAAYAGAANAGKPMLLEGGLDWKEMGLSPKDMDFGASLISAEQQIYKNLGVPIQLVMEAGATYNNMAQAKLDFYEETVLPTARWLLNALNYWLVPLFDTSGLLELRVDEKNVEALKIKYDTIAKTINDDVSMTINEKRVNLGFDTIEGGDKIVTTLGLPIAGKDADLVNSATLTTQKQPTVVADPKKKMIGNLRLFSQQ